jgi:LacI family transcriptional regulator
MILGRTGTLGVIVPFFTRPFFIEVLRGVESTAALYGKEIVLHNASTDEQREYYFSKLPMRRKVDGLLIISRPPDGSAAQYIKGTGVPTVLIDAYSPLFTSLVVNNIDGAYRAVKHLIENGHRRVGFISSAIEGDFKFNQTSDRLIGVHQALAEAKITYEPELMVTTDWNRQAGKQAAMQLLTLQEPPTAIFAASDLLALGVLEAAKELKLTVPNDLEVIGFDGIELSEILELSTVQQPMQQMGEKGTAKLVELIENPSKNPELIRFDTSLVVRSTTRLSN